MSVDSSRDIARLAKRHVRFGWWALLVSLSLGITLEILHGFKLGFYLDTSNETRRLMWTLAHAHGALFSIIHVVFGLTIGVSSPHDSLRAIRVASPCLTGACILVPGGFFLGGLFIFGGDPGAGVFLVPIGAVLLLVGVFVAAFRVTRHLDFATPAREAAKPADSPQPRPRDGSGGAVGKEATGSDKRKKGKKAK